MSKKNLERETTRTYIQVGGKREVRLPDMVPVRLAECPHHRRDAVSGRDGI